MTLYVIKIPNGVIRTIIIFTLKMNCHFEKNQKLLTQALKTVL